MKNFVIGAFLALSMCVGAPAFAQQEDAAEHTPAVCAHPLSEVLALVEQYSATVTDLSDVDRERYGRWYNELPPVTTHRFTRIFWAEAAAGTFLVFVVDDCVIAAPRVNREALKRQVPE